MSLELLEIKLLIGKMHLVCMLWVERSIHLNTFKIKLNAFDGITMLNIVNIMIHLRSLHMDYFISIYKLYVTNIVTKCNAISTMLIFSSNFKDNFIKFKKFFINCNASLHHRCRSYYIHIYWYFCTLTHSSMLFPSNNSFDFIIYDAVQVIEANYKDITHKYCRKQSQNDRNIECNKRTCCNNFLCFNVDSNMLLYLHIFSILYVDRSLIH